MSWSVLRSPSLAVSLRTAMSDGKSNLIPVNPLPVICLLRKTGQHSKSFRLSSTPYENETEEKVDV